MITMPHLTHIQYTQLDPVTWCATGQVSGILPIRRERLWDRSPWISADTAPYFVSCKFSDTSWHYCMASTAISARKVAHHQRQLQRKGVRLLLHELLGNIGIDDTLDESAFPYRLIDSKHYVCFSHTGASDKIAVSNHLSQNANDTAHSKIAVVVSRHRPAGIDIEVSDIAWHVVQRFYSGDEIAILQSLPVDQRDKIAKRLWQIKESFIKIRQYTLAQGLGMDYSSLISSLSNDLGENLSFISATGDKVAYRIAVLPWQQTVVVFESI